MPASLTNSRQIRVFISSTFRDMQAERDILIKKIFPQLRKLCEERAVTWTEVDLRWGIRDEDVAEGKVLPLCLEEIQRCRPYFIGLLGERYGSLPREIPAELLERQKWLDQHRDKSITELEIIHGVLRDEEMHGHAYFYFRDPKYVERVPKEKQSDFTAENTKSAEKLERLKNEIRRAHDQQVCRLRENFSYPERLGEWILDDFSKLIERLYPKDQTPNPLDQDAARHEAYARSRRLAFIGREDLLRRLNEHCAASCKPFVLTGESGCGKSALLAEWVARWRNDHPNDLIIQHYIGSTPDSADWQGLVRRILGGLKRAFTITDNIPVQPDALRSALSDWTARAAGSRRIVLVVDALNQLAEDGAARQLGWLPVVFPTNFRVLVSSLEGEGLEVLRKRGCQTKRVPLFEPQEIIPAVTAFFEPFGRRQLPSETLSKLVSSKAALNPLYLRAVLDELRQFGDNTKLKSKAADYLSAPDLPELFDRILTRWHEDFGRDHEHPDLVRRSLCFIACARFGLSEGELLYLLGENGDPLPRRPWTPFYLAAENAIAFRSGLLNFGHEHLRAAVQKRWLKDTQTVRVFHKQLAEYFGNIVEHTGRKLNELPWLLSKLESWDKLAETLTDPAFFVSLHVKEEFALNEYWSLIERKSQWRMAEVYRSWIDAPVDNWVCAVVLMNLLDATGHWAEALAMVQRLRNYHQQNNDQNSLAHDCLMEGSLHAKLGQLGLAQKCFETTAQVSSNTGNLRGIGGAFGNLAQIAFDQGDLQSAFNLYSKQAEICRQAGPTSGLTHALMGASGLLIDRGALADAKTLLEEHERLCHDRGDLDGLQQSFGEQALIHMLDRTYTQALELLQKQKEICRRIGKLQSLAKCLHNEAGIFLSQGKAQDALRLFQEQEQIARTLGDPIQEHEALSGRATVHSLHGKLQDGLILVTKAVDYFRTNNLPRYLGGSLFVRGKILIRKGDLPEALRNIDEAETVSRGLVNGIELAGTLCDVGQNFLTAFSAFHELMKSDDGMRVVASSEGWKAVNNVLFYPSHAATYFRKAINVMPSLADAHFGLGEALGKLDRRIASVIGMKENMENLETQIEAAYREALKLRPAWPEVEVKLAELLLQKASV